MSKLKMRRSDKTLFQDSRKTHAYLQAILKAHVKFQKDRPNTVGGVKGTRYLLPIHICNIRTKQMSKLKCGKSDKKLFQDSEKSICIFSRHPKRPCKVSKGSDKNCCRS